MTSLNYALKTFLFLILRHFPWGYDFTGLWA